MPVDIPCTMLIRREASELATKDDIRRGLESKDVEIKAGALRAIITAMTNGADMQSLMMTVIRYCINEQDHKVQKLLMLFWEIARKNDENGKLLPEMILVCNAIRNMLIHPNEYLRGCTLRFLCKIHEREVLESLVPSIKQCLTHRHPYVRRNAILAVHSLYENFGQELVPDAPELIEKCIEEESDASARRNAFMMLFVCDQPRAMKFFAKNVDKIESFGSGFQLTLLELTRKVCRHDPVQKSKFIRPIFSLLSSSNAAVCFEASSTLISLSSAPTAVRAVAQTYTKLLEAVSDNNVKLILLERLATLKGRGHTKILREIVMDILRCLATPNIDIRKKALDIALDLVSIRNVDQICARLKKEIVATQTSDSNDTTSGTGENGGDVETTQYRELLIGSVHACAVRFPSIAPSVMDLLMDFLTAPAAQKVVEFIREAIEMFPELREKVLSKLIETLPDVTSGDVARTVLWILGQYCVEEPQVQAALQSIQQSIGELPLRPVDKGALASDATSATPEAKTTPKSTGPKILADGTYASQPALQAEATVNDLVDTMPSLRKFLLQGDWFLGSVIGSTWTKLALRVAYFSGRESSTTKSVIVDGMMAMCAILEAGTNASITNNPIGTNTKEGRKKHAGKIDQDSFERLVLCMRVLADPAASEATANVLLEGCKSAFRGLLAYNKALAQQSSEEAMDEALQYLVATGRSNRAKEEEEMELKQAEEMNGNVPGASLRAKEARVKAQQKAEQRRREAARAAKVASVTAHADDVISFRQLRPKGVSTPEDLALDDEAEISLATGGDSKNDSSDMSDDLKRVYQMTGYGDPVYLEASVSVHDYDIFLDILLVNRTDHTLTNLSVELATMGDLKIVDRPQSYTVGPKASIHIQSNIKVSSTEAGYIYGTLVYTSSARPADTIMVHLADIHMDIMDYIRPAYVDATKFRKMWADFEWENKVAVHTNLRNLQEYIVHLARVTNMRILTPIQALQGSANFLAANMYARSVFGEDALVNVSVENKQDGSIRGHIRIRAKTQGVALALGDRITAKQKF